MTKVACIPVAYGTAHGRLFEFGRPREGETVLVQAAAGGVGVAAVQLAVGGSMLQGSIACLAYRGRAITVGQAGREGRSTDVSPLLTGNQSLTGAEAAAAHAHIESRQAVGRVVLIP